MLPDSTSTAAACKQLVRRGGCIHWPGRPTFIELQNSDADDDTVAWLHRIDPSNAIALYLDCTAVTDACGASIAALPHLRELGLTRTCVTDRIIPHVCSLTSLVDLALGWTGITDHGLTEIGRMSQLEVMRLSGCGQISDRGVESLASLHNLVTLHIGESQLHASALADPQAFTSLETLNLEGTRISEALLSKLATRPTLKKLNLRRSGLSRSAIKEFRLARPDVKLHFALPRRG